MLNSELMNRLVDKVSKLVPAEVLTCKEELSHTIRTLLESSLSKLDLVTREEFDVQKSVLLKTRLLLSELEQRIAILEVALEKHMETKNSLHDQ